MKRFLRCLATLWPLHKLSAFGNRLSATYKKYKRNQFGRRQFQINLIAILTIFMCAVARAQDPATGSAHAGIVPDDIKPLQIGDTIPDELWSLPLQVVSHPERNESLALKEYNQELIVLDFGGTYCPPCIHSLKSYDALSASTKGKIAVLGITSESESTVSKFLNRQLISVPMVVQERRLSKYFDFNVIPHLVWIHRNRVVAFTGSEHLNDHDIARVLNGQVSALTMKMDDFEFDARNPLLINGNGGSASLIWHSILTAQIESVPSGTYFRRIENGDINGVSFINMSPYLMLREAFALLNPVYAGSGRVVFDCEATSASMHDQFRNDMLLSYNIVIPPNAKANIPMLVIDDLNRYFKHQMGFTAAIQQRVSEVFELTGEYGQRLNDQSPEERRLGPNSEASNNWTIGDLLKRLERANWKLNTPFVSDLNADTRLTIALEPPFDDFASVNRKLSEIGLAIQKRRRVIDVVVITYVENQNKDN